ncbi:hypothetical protein DBV15_11026 [Temnothorax longispinosus]|uniref:Uncharacterized protein n=1 Tax=Temnothorax longispinosus TaxID=300112 RepID=A0A4S2KMI9_9HYME|nr:hypothetical protein DBV15_11026 [Temnothorax longispinosus]
MKTGEIFWTGLSLCHGPPQSILQERWTARQGSAESESIKETLSIFHETYTSNWPFLFNDIIYYYLQVSNSVTNNRYYLDLRHPRDKEWLFK